MGWRLLQPRERTILGFGLATMVIVSGVIGAFVWLFLSELGLPLPTETWIALGAIPAVGGLALVLSLKWIRGRMLSMAALREAVIASENTKALSQELLLADRFGREARAWNALIDRLGGQCQAEIDTTSAGSGTSAADARLALSVCSALWQGVLVVGPKLDVRYANPAAAMLLGIDATKLVGASVIELLEMTALLDDASGQSPTLRRGTLEVERPVGESTAHLRVSVRSGRDGDGSVVVIEDVTQLQAAEEARANFIAHATHELRTPLTNMRLYAETALGDDCDEAMLGTCLNVINQEVRRLERVVSDMLSVSEMEAGALSIQEGEARLDQLFEELKLEFEHQAKDKGVTLKFTLPPKLPVIKGDRDKLLQAYHNVLGNAIKYTPQGGEVTLSADQTDEGLIVTVRDTGVGISEADKQRIFERFYRTDDVRASGAQGTGLGLTLAKEIMLCHEGLIDVDSTPGKGSVFTLSLPSGRLVA